MYLKIVFKLTLILVFSGLTGSLSAQSTRFWGSAVNGPWQGTGNQWNVVPGENDYARFGNNAYDEGAAFTVNLTQNTTNAYMRLDGSNFFTLTLNLNGFNYTAATVSTTGTSMTVVGRDSGNNNALVVTGGGTFQIESGLQVARVAGSTGHVTVTGAGTVLSTGNLATTQIGTGTGTLEILNGAVYQSLGAVRVGWNASGRGTVVVDNGTWTASGGELNIGTGASGAQGSLTVRNGGVVRNTATGTNGHINFAATSGTTATAMITGEGSELIGGGISIGGRIGNTGGTAQINVRDGAKVGGGTLRMFSEGTLSIDGGTASFTSLGLDTLAVAGNIDLVLNGESSPLIEVSQNAWLDADDLFLSLSLGDGVTYQLNDEIQLLQYGGSLAGSFSNITEGDKIALGDYEFEFSYQLSSGADTFVGLTVTAIPEPAVWMLSLAGIVLLMVIRKRGGRI